LTQTVLLQEQALKQADQRLHELETLLQERDPPQDQPDKLSGWTWRTIFIGTQNGERRAVRCARSTAPQDMRAPLWSRGTQPPYPAGNSFLSSALSTAAGVAGGALLFQGISSLFQNGPAVDDVAAAARNRIARVRVVAPPAFDSYDNVIREAD